MLTWFSGGTQAESGEEAGPPGPTLMACVPRTAAWGEYDGARERGVPGTARYAASRPEPARLARHTGVWFPQPCSFACRIRHGESAWFSRVRACPRRWLAGSPPGQGVGLIRVLGEHREGRPHHSQTCVHGPWWQRARPDAVFIHVNPNMRE